MKGYSCDVCGRGLKDNEFDCYGSWSYTCSYCGFHYSHNSPRTLDEQVADFEERELELEEMYSEDIDEDEEMEAFDKWWAEVRSLAEGMGDPFPRDHQDLPEFDAFDYWQSFTEPMDFVVMVQENN